MIEIEKLSDSSTQAVKHIRLADDQIKFAGTAEEFLADANDSVHLHVIKHGNEVVGFFKLDTAYASVYSFCPTNAIGLRAFVVDKRHQGKGIGTGAVRALLPYLKQNYAEFDAIYLTVNCKNPSAQACYQKGGFTFTGEQYLGGAAGPQNIMFARI